MSNGKAQRYVSKQRDFAGTIIIERPDWMQSAYNYSLESYGPILSLDPNDPADQSEIIYQKNLLLDEIFKLAGWADMHSIVTKTRKHVGPDTEASAQDVFEALVQSYIKDPKTKSYIGRVRSWQKHDKEYDIGRQKGHYDVPNVSLGMRKKTIELIGDPDLKPVMPSEPEISKISSDMEQSFGEPTDGEETLPTKLNERKIRIRFIKK
jgi:hypothetical protein